MARPSAKLEQAAKAVALADIESILGELAKSSASKKDLLTAAKVIRLAISMGFDLQNQGYLIEIVQGKNKHELNFTAELEAL